MAEETLVSTDIDRGAALIRALDKAGFPVVAAMWLYRTDLEAWQLTIASPRANELRQAYGEIREIADRAGVDIVSFPHVSLVPPTDKTIFTLSKARRLEGLGGVRLSTSMINGVYIEDAYVYRAAA